MKSIPVYSSKDIAETKESDQKGVGMRKYPKKAQEKVAEAMHEMKEGTLRTGTGKKVTDRKQAIAIGLSEAREEGVKVPKKKQ